MFIVGQFEFSAEISTFSLLKKIIKTKKKKLKRRKKMKKIKRKQKAPTIAEK